MGENMKSEEIGLIDELMQGKELAEKLFDHLSSSSSSSSSSHVTNEELIEKILSNYEKLFSMLNWKGNVMGESNKINNNGKNIIDSNCSLTNNGSPRSEVLDEPEIVKHKDVFKKRKTMPRWTEQVKVCSGTIHDGALDDGYCWRKYGQKDILGAKFPRGYYRCTHRNVQGCLATKQVQKSDNDPLIFEITYRGRHTCTQAGHSNKASPSKPKMDLVENKNQITHQEEKIELAKETIFSFESSDLEVKVEDLENKEDIFPSFNCFASPSIGSENDDNNNMFFMEGFSSESNMFGLSQLGIGQSVQTSESDTTEIVSAPTSVTNSPMIDLDLFLDNMDFDADFPIDAPELYS